MPWDSIDKYRDEDNTERRRKSRRRYKIGGRRLTDNQKLQRKFPFLRHNPESEDNGST